MAQSFPADVIVLDEDALLHARLARGKKGPRIVQAKSYRLGANTFVPAVVTPQLTNESSLADAVRRLRVETGRWDSASVLLPDSWFRMNILELPVLPESAKDAEDMVRWSLKRTMPLDPMLLRIRYEVLSRTPSHTRVLAVSAIEQTLAAIEKVFATAASTSFSLSRSASTSGTPSPLGSRTPHATASSSTFATESSPPPY